MAITKRKITNSPTSDEDVINDLNKTIDQPISKEDEAYIENWIEKDLGIVPLKKLGKVARRKDVNPERGKKKYGDVKFADPKNHKYPIDTEKHIRAAWSYINKPKNAAKYSAADVKTIKAHIVAAWKAKIDKNGPPSAKAAKKFDGAERDFHKFAPILKVEKTTDDSMIVWFRITSETPDSQNEIMDYAKSKSHFEEWSKHIQKISQGKSVFNVYEGHDPSKAIGRAVRLLMRDDHKDILAGTEIIDPVAREKFEKGVLNGASIGGRYGEIWNDTSMKGFKRYEAYPREYSIVGVPANSDAIPVDMPQEFEFQNSDGQIEMRKFQMSSEETVKTDNLKKALADLKEKPDFKKFISLFTSLKKEDGEYEINPDYARQEAWDVSTAAQVIQIATQLMSGEATEPEDAKEVANIIRGVLDFMSGEVDEMESAATGEEPEDDEEQEEETEEGEPDEEADDPEEAGEEPEDGEPDEALIEAHNKMHADLGDEGDDEHEHEGIDPDMHSKMHAMMDQDETEEVDDEKLKQLIREVLTEMADAEKADRAGELAKLDSLVNSKTGVLEKVLASVKTNFEKVSKDLAGDIAKVGKAHNDLEDKVEKIQKAVESYGPVIHQTPPPPEILFNNGQSVTEKDILKSALMNNKLSPQIRQAYQARLTELEIKDGKPLEEPPEFIR